MESDQGPDVSDLTSRLTELEARQDTRDRLADGVERLANETGGLNALLTRVDEQQHRLSSLGREVAQVKQRSVTKEDLARQLALDLKKKREARRKKMQQFVTWGITALALLCVLAVVAINRQAEEKRDRQEYQQGIYEICQERYRQAQKIRKLIDQAPTPETPDEAARRVLILEAFPLIGCEKVKPQ